MAAAANVALAAAESVSPDQLPEPEPKPAPRYPGLRGELIYFDLPRGQHTVDEKSCRSRRVRTAHFVTDARAVPGLSLRTCGFQLFNAAPPAGDIQIPGYGGVMTGSKHGTHAYLQSTEEFTRAALQDPASFDLAPGERSATWSRTTTPSGAAIRDRSVRSL